MHNYPQGEKETMAPRTRSGRRWISFILLLVAVAFLWAIYKSRPDLLARARRASGFELMTSCGVFAWKDEHTAFIGTAGKRYEFNIATGRVVEISRPKVPGITIVPNNALSPDGRKLVRLLRDHSSLRIESADQSARPVRAWRTMSRTTEVAWRCDSRAVVQYDRAPSTVQLFRLDGTSSPRIAITVAGTGWVLGVDRDENLYWAPLQNRAAQPRIWVIPSVAPERARELRVPFPKGVDLFEAHLSPKGDRILWWLGIRDTRPSWIRSLQRLLRFGVTPASPVWTEEGFWISRPDGGDFREIGRVAADGSPAGLHEPAWLPDGRHVSFFYLKGLHVVPVD